MLTQAFKIVFNLFSHFLNLVRTPVLERFNPNLDWALTKLGLEPSYYINRTKKKEKEIVKRGTNFGSETQKTPYPLSLLFFLSSSRMRPPGNRRLSSASSTTRRRWEKENRGPLPRLTHRWHPPTAFLLFSLLNRAREPHFGSPEPTTCQNSAIDTSIDLLYKFGGRIRPQISHKCY